MTLQSPASPTDTAGYAGLLIEHTIKEDQEHQLLSPAIHSIKSTDHLAAGDVVALQPTGYIRTLYRRSSRHNVIFATDRCNSLCLMCSQPPREVDETGIMAEHLRLIRLMDPTTPELGITGGEPTLLGDGFIELVQACKDHLPNTPLHILSNGRLFYYGSFAKRLADINHPNMMLGIPIYSDVDSEHDYIVQARGAFDETMVGFHNLGRFAVPVEIRVVIHRFTYQRLLPIAEFIYRNIPFAAHVALMGLEPIGFAITNFSALWVDPHEYGSELARATEFLTARGMNVSIYNHQLCTTPKQIWPFTRKSISDWKNIYLAECDNCLVREQCGGFFQSAAIRHSAHIRPILEHQVGAE
ncbi:MAG: His-Xaa-Ser system radical SAM maturase HxsC [Acidobacteria bacterium]|nr:His-Xaa-Ser system radical SAM maturase HxsC [Acidobacteriota bacterium]